MKNVKFKNEKDFGNFLEYITDSKRLLEILKDYTFDIEYVDFAGDYVYKFVIKHKLENGKVTKRTFNYYEGCANEMLNEKNAKEKILNALWCLVRESLSFFENMSVTDFQMEFGYNDYECNKIYNGVMKNGKRMEHLFTENNVYEMCELMEF